MQSMYQIIPKTEEEVEISRPISRGCKRGGWDFPSPRSSNSAWLDLGSLGGYPNESLTTEFEPHRGWRRFLSFCCTFRRVMNGPLWRQRTLQSPSVEASSPAYYKKWQNYIKRDNLYTEVTRGPICNERGELIRHLAISPLLPLNKWQLFNHLQAVKSSPGSTLRVEIYAMESEVRSPLNWDKNTRRSTSGEELLNPWSSRRGIPQVDISFYQATSPLHPFEMQVSRLLFLQTLPNKRGVKPEKGWWTVVVTRQQVTRARNEWVNAGTAFRMSGDN